MIMRYKGIQIIRRYLYLLFVLLYSPVVLNGQTVKDIDGNIYVTIPIGNQIWIEENLKTTRYNDGRKIPLVSEQKAWRDLDSPAYCYYDNKPENGEIYGALYNWHAVRSGKLCPSGWHVPTLGEWKSMVAFLGDPLKAGDKLKESGYDHWQNRLIDATNDYDFTALPGGTRLYSGFFPTFGNSYAVWWTSTEYSSLAAWNYGLHDSSSRIFNGYDNKQCGFSVRCVKD